MLHTYGNKKCHVKSADFLQPSCWNMQTWCCHPSGFVLKSWQYFETFCCCPLSLWRSGEYLILYWYTEAEWIETSEILYRWPCTQSHAWLRSASPCIQAAVWICTGCMLLLIYFYSLFSLYEFNRMYPIKTGSVSHIYKDLPVQSWRQRPKPGKRTFVQHWTHCRYWTKTKACICGHITLCSLYFFYTILS